MRVNFIRHGKTSGNLEGRYIGITDQALCETGIKDISRRLYPSCDIAICSPMKRCVQTARLIYPNITPVICNDLCECDFGDFEGKNAYELANNPDYQRWIDSGGSIQFPNGENICAFKERCCGGFLEMTQKYKSGFVLSFIIHGGTLMSIMEKFAVPKRNYYDFQVSCGYGYIAEFDGEKITIISEIK